MDILTRAVPARTTPVPAETDIGALRARLPHLVARERTISLHQQAIAEFGLAYGSREIARKLVTYLPWRPFRDRVMVCVEIAHYRRDVPDAALVAWERAVQSGFFQSFCIAEPEYETRQSPAADPWLIGWLKEEERAGSHTHGPNGTGGVFPSPRSSRGRGHGIILAYWE